MVIVRYYMYIVERGKFIAFCKVFQHHSSLFPIISHYSTTYLILLHHSSLFSNIPYYSTSFYKIRQHSPLSLIFRQHLLSFDNILQNITSFSIFSHTSTSFDKSTSFFYNIFRHHFFSTTFDNILQNLYSTEIFVFCCQIKKLSFAVLSICYQLNIIILLLST